MPNPRLRSDPACIAFRSFSSPCFLGSAHRFGAGGAAQPRDALPKKCEDGLEATDIDGDKMSRRSSGGAGFGCGSIIALIISVALNHSFWWAVLHLFLSWIYVVYVVIFRGSEIIPAVSRLFR